MSNSLFDQLKKSGLVNDKQARQAKQSQYQNQKQQKGKKQTVPVDEAKQIAQKALAEKLERDRLLNQQQKEEAQQKAVAAQIKQLIESNRIENQNGEISYSFVDGKVVKRIYVNAAIHKELSNGNILIARLGGRYELVPPEVADKISARDASYIIAHTSTQESPAEDDPYAAYKIPDDLMW